MARRHPSQFWLIRAAHFTDHHQAQLLDCIESHLLPEQVVCSFDPHDPVRDLNFPRPWAVGISQRCSTIPTIPNAS